MPMFQNRKWTSQFHFLRSPFIFVSIVFQDSWEGGKGWWENEKEFASQSHALGPILKLERYKIAALRRIADYNGQQLRNNSGGGQFSSQDRMDCSSSTRSLYSSNMLFNSLPHAHTKNDQSLHKVTLRVALF